MEPFAFLGLGAIQSEMLSILILLFLGSSTQGEYISKSKYPEYAKYVKSVNRYFPGKSSYICEQ